MLLQMCPFCNRYHVAPNATIVWCGTAMTGLVDLSEINKEQEDAADSNETSSQ